MPTTSYKLTVDDLDEFPDDGLRYELINGELFYWPSCTPRHQSALGDVLRLLGNYIDERRHGRLYVGPIDVRFSGKSQVAPDIVFIGRDRIDIIGGKRLEGAPTLIVEVLSPATRLNDTIKKRALYERYGVPEYWLVDPRRKSLTILSIDDGRYVEQPKSGHPRSHVLPDLEIDVPALMADLD